MSKKDWRNWTMQVLKGSWKVCLVAALASMQPAATGLAEDPANYPIGDRDTMWIDPYRIGSLRHMGEIYLSRAVERPPAASPLPAGTELTDLTYRRYTQNDPIETYFERSHTTGMIVLHEGKIVFERYLLGADASSTFASNSIAKSVVSTLLGLAIGDGLIRSVNDPVSDYLPELKGSGYEGVPIKAVLQMSSGIAWNEDYVASTSDINRLWDASVQRNAAPVTDFVRDLKRRHDPFARFQYAGADTIVLGWLVTRVTGQNLSAYLEAKLWHPLGMEADASWMIDTNTADAREIAFCCLNAVLRDYARLGLLMAQNGIWQGQRLLPEGWVAEATRPDRPQIQPGKLYRGYDLGYQYQWWTFPGDDHAFAGLGVNGQFLYVNPARQLVIVITSAWPRWWSVDLELDTYAVFDAIAARLAP
jgi:CubicO group peptidase (beta-lactamase class C family)